MSEDGDNDPESKTEEPTQRRIDQAAEQGRFVTSKEINSFVIILYAALLFSFVIPMLSYNIASYIKLYIINAHDIDVTHNLGRVLFDASVTLILYSAAPFILLLFIIIVVSNLQKGRVEISAEPLMPDLSRISIFKGFSRIFSKQSFVEFIKNILKVSIFTAILYQIIMEDIKELTSYIGAEVNFLIDKLYDVIKHLLVKIAIILGVLAALDYLYQYYVFYQSLRMSKEELKEEFKQSEGNPEVKKKQRQLRQSSRSRMISKVPTADVVITNPTHYSIALKYDKATMTAPIVIAKGVDFMALRIREIAKENEIPIVDNPPLARALYSNVEVDSEVPIEYYEAVAKVISYIYKLKDAR